MGDLVSKTHKSQIDKAPRTTMADEIAAFQKKHGFPGPNVHKPNHDCIKKRNVSCLSFKGDRVSFISDAMWKGMNQPDFHNKTHELTEKRTQAPMYRAPGKHDLAGPAFLRKSTATKLIAPTTYNASDSFK